MLTGKTGILVIAALVLAAMGATAALLRSRSDDGDGGSSTSTLEAPAGQAFRAKRLGVAGVRPPGWRLRRLRRAVRLTSPDRAGLVAVSATPFPVSARALLASTSAAVRRSYRGVRFARRRAVKLGGIGGTMADATATNSRGVRLDLLVATAKGRRRTYLLQVFVARDALGGPRLAEAQAIVDSLELSG